MKSMLFDKNGFITPELVSSDMQLCFYLTGDEKVMLLHLLPSVNFLILRDPIVPDFFHISCKNTEFVEANRWINRQKVAELNRLIDLSKKRRTWIFDTRLQVRYATMSEQFFKEEEEREAELAKKKKELEEKEMGLQKLISFFYIRNN
jgi:hypothetical protein